ncbi:amino acid transporter [Aspergillus taichungensis]|uniref:Amino acid transporter n=1 Tax=Aspergillus taichungensis TaxID=482145 RepID=A0A2J5I4G3_9EURO|nr:amino acid transporter [Aspergillus taichungensis]
MDADTLEMAASPTHRAQPNANSRPAGKWKQQRELNTIDVACLIINKMIGGGVFVSSSHVVSLTGNKLVALCLWIFGGIYSFCSMYVYLEYGLAWPYNGGEFLYLAKIFPVPPMVFASAFAWFFVLFATTTNNSITFATYINPHDIEDPDEWMVKFIACAAVLAVACLHYRMVNIGIQTNNILAAYKVIFLGVMGVAGLIATCRNGTRGELAGLNDYTSPGDGRPLLGGNVSLAILQVLYSYHGWENANYVTSEIKGDDKETLKRGALIGVGVVNCLYILFNLSAYFLLDFQTIIDQATLFPVKFAETAFESTPGSTTKWAICVCVALCALGNLTGVIFTNARVARNIAHYRLIPFYQFFGTSSRWGRREGDGLGTPSGGLALHSLVTCIYVASIPGVTAHSDGKLFVLTLYTYGHSVVTFILGIGLPFLPHRIHQYDTRCSDPGGYQQRRKWTSYQVLSNRAARYGVVAFFTLVNGFLIGMPLGLAQNTAKSHREIPSWVSAVTALSVFGFGTLVALYIICFVRDLNFQQTSAELYVPHNKRMWVVEYPDFTQWCAWKQTFVPRPWTEIKGLLVDNAEATSAARCRQLCHDRENSYG